MAHLQKRPRVLKIRKIEAFVLRAGTQVRHAAKLWRYVDRNMKCILIVILLITPSTCFAKWKDIPLETVVRDSDLVVIATLTDVHKLVTGNKVYCQGDLQIAEVLKGIQTNSVVIKWIYSIPPKSISVDHSNIEGKSILWLLKLEEDKSFSAHYHKRVQNIEKTIQIKEIIESNHNQPK
jgi:hypothetical protein